MGFLNKFIITLCALTLLALAIDMSMVAIFSTPQSISQTLNKAGLYTAVAPQVADMFVKDIQISDTSNDQLVAAVKSAIQPSVIEASLQPTIFSLSSWLQKPSTEPVPDLSIDMSPIKAALVSELTKTLPADQVDSAQFEITKSIPDSFSLADIGKSGDQNADPTKNTITQPLQTFKATYLSASQFPPLLAGVIVFWLLILLLINLRHGRRKLTAPAWAFGWAAVLGVIVIYVVPTIATMLAPNVNSGSSSLNPASLITNVSAVLAGQLWPFVIGYSVVAFVLFIAAHVLMHPHEKKHT